MELVDHLFLGDDLFALEEAALLWEDLVLYVDARNPARSYSCMVRRTFMKLPYPVSASQITGTETAP